MCAYEDGDLCLSVRPLTVPGEGVVDKNKNTRVLDAEFEIFTIRGNIHFHL